MNDLEIIRLCARAMWFDEKVVLILESGFNGRKYDPLHNDDEVMALVKKFRLGITSHRTEGGVWAVSGDGGGTLDADLNRAICTCVAQLMKAKPNV